MRKTALALGAFFPKAVALTYLQKVIHPYHLNLAIWTMRIGAFYKFHIITARYNLYWAGRMA